MVCLIRPESNWVRFHCKASWVQRRREGETKRERDGERTSETQRKKRDKKRKRKRSERKRRENGRKGNKLQDKTTWTNLSLAAMPDVDRLAAQISINLARIGR